MKPWIFHTWAFLFVAIAIVGGLKSAVADEPPVTEVRDLIAKLGNDDFQIREQAEAKLIDLGELALAALRAAAKSDDAEIAFRAERAVQRITSLSAVEQAELRNQAQAALHTGDYDEAIRALRRLNQALNRSIDDRRWLGHAYQLSSRWKEAAAAYTAALEQMDVILDGGVEPRSPGSNSWPSNMENGVQERVATILLLARIERHYLNDPIAAEKTLKRVFRFNDILNETLDELAKKWRTQVASGLQEGKELGTWRGDPRLSMSVRFPMMALRELAAVQELDGKHAEALESWRRVHFTTSHYVGFIESIDSAALDRLIQQLDDLPDNSVPGVTLLDKDRPSAAFELREAGSLARSYNIRHNNASFALSARKGWEFESLEFAVDIEQQELRYGGQFECWAMLGENGTQRKGIGSISWPDGKGTGRATVTGKFKIEPGTGIVHFQVSEWKDKFKVFGTKVTATFRPRNKDAEGAKALPGFSFHNEFLPEGGSVTLDGKTYPNNSSTYNIQPGRIVLEYSHPKSKETRRYELDLKPGGHIAMFLNLDSPLRGQLTNLRRFHSDYGPSTNVVRLPSGQWLIAWCDGGLRFATSDDLVTWSEPTATSDSQLFSKNYNCLEPTLYVDKEGTAWAAYFSNQLDIDQLNSGGYRLFLRKSTDGKEWSAPRMTKIALSGWPPGKVQMLTGPDGKTWTLYRSQYSVSDTPAGIAEFKDLEIEMTNEQKSHARNPHATIDAAGRVHLMWDHFAQTMYYARRDVDGTWTKLVEVAEDGSNKRASHPQLVIHGDRIALIYTVNQSTFLRRGELVDGHPQFDGPIKLTSHIAQLISASPLFTPDHRIVLLTGQETVWKQEASLEEFVSPPKP